MTKVALYAREQARHIGLVAAQAIQRLREHHTEPPALGVLQQRLHPGRRIMLAPEMAAS